MSRDTKNPPRVSVIIPTYNRAHYLEEAIRSVLEQTLADFELIIVDDGSTDGTVELVGRQSDDRIHLVCQEHRGIGAAMNRGLQVAGGAYVARLDSDDVWLPDILATETALLDSRPEIGVVYARGQAMGADGGRLEQTVGLPLRYEGDAPRSLLYDDTTCNITVMARRGCVDRAGGYDESLEASEDWSLWLRVARHCRFAFIDRVLARFRFHGENLTSATSPQLDEVLQNRLYVLDRFFAQPDLAANILAMRPIAYRNVYTFIAMRYLSARRPRQALGPVWRSLRTGCNPVVSLARNIWFIVAYEYFGNVAWIRTLAARVADLQSRRRRRLPRSR